MKKQTSRAGFRHTGINLLIIGLIFAIYFVMREPQTIEVFGASAIYKGKSQDCIALQCIVNWDSPHLDILLDTLDALDTRITFFVSGQWAETKPDTLLRMAREGHEVGICGFDPNSDGSHEWLIDDISRAVKAVKDVCGLTTTLYNCGVRNVSNSASASSVLGLKSILCTTDLLCGRGTKSDILTRAALAASGGNIIQISPTSAGVEALPLIIDCFQGRGLRIVKTGDILG